jgi:hypothetical protein
MSRGTPVVSFRLPPDLEQQLKEVMDRSETTRLAGPWTLSALIVSGIKEKLRHLEAGRRSRKRLTKARGPQGALVCEECLCQMTLDHAGQFTNDPVLGWVICCWDCLVKVGPFKPVPSPNEVDS